jgi:hypothetical protein
MAQDKSYISVPPISFTNSVKISNILTEEQQNEFTIRNIAKSITDNLTIYSKDGLDGIGFTLVPYNSEYSYNIDGQQVSYYLIVTITPRRPEIVLNLIPNTTQFNIYAAEFIKLYNNPPTQTEEVILTPQSSTSSQSETVTAGGSRRQEYEQKRRV